MKQKTTKKKNQRSTSELTTSPFKSTYQPTDISPFSPSGAIYFMDGYSDATVRLRDSKEEIFLAFEDQNTSISASAPILFDEDQLAEGIYTPVPKPLSSISYYPENTPSRYKRQTSSHLMQVISMNMKGINAKARLLIGLPYAEKYSSLFFRSDLFQGRGKDASSYGVVQSLSEFSDSVTGQPEVLANGFPARSFFAIFHIIETPVGNLFNKKATQMELQPSSDGKLALKLPPIPFNYKLINGPIPLYDVKRPDGDPVGDLIISHHNDNGKAKLQTEDAWPWHQVDLKNYKGAMQKKKKPN